MAISNMTYRPAAGSSFDGLTNLISKHFFLDGFFTHQGTMSKTYKHVHREQAY